MLPGILAFFAQRAVRRALPYVLAALAILGGVWWIDHRAYQRGFDTASAAFSEAAAIERKRQEDINRRAWERAQRDIEELTRQKEAADALIAQLRVQGREDPDAGRTALSSGSVRRVDSIK
ncbi:hypothetical protein Pan1_38 [Pseudanabaena phage Pan1]|nr:hypothetical protein Pan1_38 [Pseudanabaena phage Pan1]